jgi:transposase
MRFVAVKIVVQQAVLMLHKTRDLLVRKRTALINDLRAHLSEYGIVTGNEPRSHCAYEAASRGAGEAARACAVGAPYGRRQLRSLASEIDRLETQILAWRRADDTSRRLATILGIGPITASAAAAAVPDTSLFRSGRQFAAWLGLTPRPQSSAARSGSAASASRATDISVSCRSPAQPR